MNVWVKFGEWNQIDTNRELWIGISNIKWPTTFPDVHIVCEYFKFIVIEIIAYWFVGAQNT